MRYIVRIPEQEDFIMETDIDWEEGTIINEEPLGMSFLVVVEDSVKYLVPTIKSNK
jgi:hypothetical protein